jgi:hypothetical protein
MKKFFIALGVTLLVVAALIDSPKQVVVKEAVAVEPTPTPKPNWNYGSNSDKMEGSITKWGMNESTNKVSMKFPYQGGTSATIVVFDDGNVKIRMSKGQVLCTSYNGCMIRVKFDDGKPEFLAANGADSSLDSQTIWISKYQGHANRFINKLKSSKKVMVELEVYQEGSPVFEFDVADFQQPKKG